MATVYYAYNETDLYLSSNDLSSHATYGTDQGYTCGTYSGSSSSSSYNKSTCTKITILDTISPGSCYGYFYYFTKVTQVDGIINLNTSNVTNMNSMFEDCHSLTSLDVSNFDTSNVTTMQYMFGYCKALTSLDLSNFNTASVTNMQYMFHQCSSLSNIKYLSNFNTNNVTKTTWMFGECSKLVELDLSGFNTKNIVNSDYMFSGCSQLTTIRAYDFDISNIASSANMFNGCSKLVGAIAYDSSKITADYANSKTGYFKAPIVSTVYYAYNDTNLYLSHEDLADSAAYGTLKGYTCGTYRGGFQSSEEYNKSTCTDITILNIINSSTYFYYFYKYVLVEEIKGLEKIRFSLANSLRAMFYNCKKLKNIDKIDFSTTQGKTGIKITDISQMFCGCESLKTIDLSNLYFDKYESCNFDDAFLSCYSLEEIKFSKRYKIKVNSLNRAFSACKALKSIDLSNFDTSDCTNMYDTFNNNDSLTSLDLSSFNTSNVTDFNYMFYGCDNLTTIYSNDFDFSKATTNSSYIFKDSKNLVGAISYDSNKVSVDYANTKTGYFTSINLSTVYCAYNETEMYLSHLSLANDPVYGTEQGYTCEQYNPDSQETTYNKQTIEKITILNEIKRNNYDYFFSGFINLLSIENIYNINTSNAKNFGNMFYKCKKLTYLDLSTFNTQNADSMTGMFLQCEELKGVNLSSFDTSKVTSMSYMFQQCKKLTDIDLSNFDTRNVTAMGQMFVQCESLKTIDISNFDTSKVSIMESVFWYCSSLEKIYSNDFDLSNATNILQMFSGCTKLVGAISYDSSKITAEYANTTTGYFTAPNYDNVYYAYDDENLYLSHNDLSEGIFGTENGYSCGTYLKTTASVYLNTSTCRKIDILNKVVPSSENQNYFAYFAYVSTINGLKNLDTSNLTTMQNMFYRCEKVKSLDLSNFNTSQVTHMGYMFSACYGVKQLDLSSFNTSNVKYMHCMFNQCNNLENLDLSNFNTSNVCDMQSMFFGCYKLENINISNINTSNVTNMSYMFYYCESLENLNVSSFDTSNVTNMSSMFQQCKKLKYLNLSNFKTSKVTNMFYMFYYCESLENLNVSSFDTSNVTNMNSMFGHCSSLESIDVSNFNTSKSTTLESMFYYCNKLKTLDVTSFDTSSAANLVGMFNSCYKLTTIYSNDFDLSSATDTSGMFNNCNALVGATSYISSRGTDGTYANSTTGYFTKLKAYIRTFRDGIDTIYPQTVFDAVQNSDGTKLSSTINSISETLTAANTRSTENRGIVSNPNLLDNGFYTINQRGFSSGSAGGYCADRWRYSDTCTANVITNGLHLKRTANGTFIYECIEMSRFDTTKQVTLTFNTSVGALKLTTEISADTFNVFGTASNGVCARLYRGSGQDYLRCMLETTSTSGAEVDVYSAKLEYGTLSTLANDSAPNYASELVKCQRYCIALKGSTDFRLRTATVGASSMDFSIPIPTTMRARPSLTNNGMSIYSLSFTQQTGFSFSVIGHSDVAILLRATKSSHGLSDAVLAVNTTSYLSADL